MKLQNVIDNLNGPSFPFYDIEDFLLEFEKYEYLNLDKHGFTEKYIKVWYCTDSWVGMKVIFHNDEPICISETNNRKDNNTYSWLSKEKYLKTKAFIESLSKPVEQEITYVDLEKEFNEFYSIDFTGQLMEDFHSTAMYNDKPVNIDWDKTIQEKRKDYIAKIVWIFCEDNLTSICVDIKDLKFPVSIKQN